MIAEGPLTTNKEAFAGRRKQTQRQGNQRKNVCFPKRICFRWKTEEMLQNGQKRHIDIYTERERERERDP